MCTVLCCAQCLFLMAVPLFRKVSLAYTPQSHHITSDKSSQLTFITLSRALAVSLLYRLRLNGDNDF